VPDLTAPQPAPDVTRFGDCVQDLVETDALALGRVGELVAADVVARKAHGIATYGTVLRPWNGRDALVDLYQELLDGAMYARQAVLEGVGREGVYRRLLRLCVEVRGMLADREHAGG
jgi:hypothetical protein